MTQEYISLSDLLSANPNGKKGRNVDPDRRRSIMQALALCHLFGDRRPNPIALAYNAGGIYFSLIGPNAQIKSSHMAYVQLGIANQKDEHGNETNTPGILSAEFGRIKAAMLAELRNIRDNMLKAADPIEYLKKTDLPAYLNEYRCKVVRDESKKSKIFVYRDYKLIPMTTEHAEKLVENLSNLS